MLCFTEVQPRWRLDKLRHSGQRSGLCGLSSGHCEAERVASGSAVQTFDGRPGHGHVALQDRGDAGAVQAIFLLRASPEDDGAEVLSALRKK